MLNDYQYKLEPYTGRNSRHTCPGCKKPHQFTRYIDTGSGEPISNNVGKCNRVNKCGYHYTPGQYFQKTGNYPALTGRDFLLGQGEVSVGRRGFKGLMPPSHIDKTIFLKSLSAYELNNFVKYLHSRFNEETVNHLIKYYQIGTSSRWNGGTTIFWQVDISGSIRTGKLIKYNAVTGKRYKNKTNWAHSVMQLPGFDLKQCFFGEHLLTKYPHKPVGLVESEKTAIIASIYFPELVWLASGGANSINTEKVKAFRTREVVLFPDASASGEIYHNWCEIAKKYGFSCSDFIEKNATKEQKVHGIDIADLLESVDKKRETSTNSETTSGLNKNTSNQKLSANLGMGQTKLTTQTSQKKELFEYPTTPVPYNKPSPVAIIDSNIDTVKIFKREELIIKNRVFTAHSGDVIELVGIRDYGYCNDYKTHKKQNGYCRECLLNCIHTVKINGVLQRHEYTQMEILLMQ